MAAADARLDCISGASGLIASVLTENGTGGESVPGVLKSDISEG